KLLDVCLAAGLFDLGLGFVGFVLVDAFLDRLRRGVNHVLGFLQAETGDLADSLNDLDLVAADIGENNVEFALLFLFSATTATGWSSTTSNCHGGSSRYVPLLF